MFVRDRGDANGGRIQIFIRQLETKKTLDCDIVKPVTLRDNDTGNQIRISTRDWLNWMAYREEIDGYLSLQKNGIFSMKDGLIITTSLIEKNSFGLKVWMDGDCVTLSTDVLRDTIYPAMKYDTAADLGLSVMKSHFDQKVLSFMEWMRECPSKNGEAPKEDKWDEYAEQARVYLQQIAKDLTYEKFLFLHRESNLSKMAFDVTKEVIRYYTDRELRETFAVCAKEKKKT